MLRVKSEERDLIRAKAPVTRNEDYPPELIRAVQFGIEVERFMQTPIGTYLWNRAMKQITESAEALFSIDDISSPEAKVAHDQARIGNMFVDWLNEGLQEARDAEIQLEEVDEHVEE